LPNKECTVKILAAYKPAAEGEHVIQAAVAEAKLRNAKLIIARHVQHTADLSAPLNPPTEQSGSGRRSLSAESGQSLTKIREEMDALERSIELQGLSCEAVLLTDNADHADQLLQFADAENIDLIVLGVRRRSRVGKAILGSESQDILLRANCPVLAVKAD